MASAWGNSWGTSWANSWGDGILPPEPKIETGKNPKRRRLAYSTSESLALKAEKEYNDRALLNAISDDLQDNSDKPSRSGFVPIALTAKIDPRLKTFLAEQRQIAASLPVDEFDEEQELAIAMLMM